MKAYVINDGGFSFGMDSVTPVQWRFSHRELKRKVYRSWLMPYYMTKWCKQNPHWIGSMSELLQICADVKATS